MESDKKNFETEHLEHESSDFLEYQHKKLEKVAEIIKEEERAAKLLEETENAALDHAPKTRVVIDSIVKHEKPRESVEPQQDEDVVDGLYIEPLDYDEASESDSVEATNIPDDASTFEAIDEVIQAAQNDFDSLPESIESSDEVSELSSNSDSDDQSMIELEVLPETVDLPIDKPQQGYKNDAVIDGLAIESIEMIDPEAGENNDESDIEIVSSSDLLGDDAEDIAEDELADAAVDFEAAEEATDAEVVERSMAIDYSQPKISKIGRLLLELGKISRSDTKKILRTQKKHGLLFGDAALKLGLISDDDIQKVVAMQFNYHYLQAGQGKFSDDLVAAYAPFSKKVENYRALRSQLMMRWFKKGHRSLAIVGANSGDGVSYLTANLGVVFSQLGARTLIIEANMRSPRHQEIFNIRTHSGLSDMIVGKIGRDAIQEIDSIPDLSVLHAGTVPPNPQELLGRTSFNILFKNLSDDYDVILIDTPPVVQSADAQSVIEMCEGAMLVSRLHQTKHTDVLEMRHLIEMTGATIVSAVMNDF